MLLATGSTMDGPHLQASWIVGEGALSNQQLDPEAVEKQITRRLAASVEAPAAPEGKKTLGNMYPDARQSKRKKTLQE